MKVRICYYCKREVPWKWLGKRLKDGTKLYVDAGGSRWAGRRCPLCERKRVQASLHCRSFERDLITKVLAKDGYRILNSTHPIQVEYEGRVCEVGILHATAAGDKITLEEHSGLDQDLYALVFASVRIVPKSALQRLDKSSKNADALSSDVDTENNFTRC